tara:strand:- start:3774 stop:4061 length:288 start_codon:yes stop_codon:yes gene_type:complete
MSESNSEQPLTGFDLWTPNDYSNFITISAAAIGSTLLVIFKSRCKKISICWGLLGCDREVQTDSDEENPADADAGAGDNQPQVNPPQAPVPVQNP